MTDTPFSTPPVTPSTIILDAWLNEIEVAGGPTMPAHQLEAFLDNAPIAVKESAVYQYWRGVADAHEIHLNFGGVAA